MSGDWRADVCSFWFGLDDDRWFNPDPALDFLVKQRFLNLWADKRQLPLEAFLDSSETAIAGAILFDQFPRNMFRGIAEQFATDHVALAIAKAAIENEFDDQLATRERAFLYLPFEHSENLADQKRSVLLFTALGDARQLGFAKLHHDIIDKFGRFPHRNAILGRSPRSEELAAGDIVPW